MKMKTLASAAAFPLCGLAATQADAAAYTIRVGNGNPNPNHAVVKAMEE